MAEKKAAEDELIAAVSKDPGLAELRTRPGKTLPTRRRSRPNCCTVIRSWSEGSALTARSSASRGRSSGTRKKKGKPERDRLREYTTARRPSLELELFSTEPIYPDFETVKLADSLTWLTSQLRNEPQFVKEVFAGKSPQERAYELVHDSKLEDVDVRKKLYEEGASANRRFARSDDSAGEARRSAGPRGPQALMETKVEEVERQAYAQIAKAKYAIGGKDVYPDATFTLRLAFGTVKGYEEEGKHIPFETTFAGLYERSKEHHDKVPFDLPPRWVERKDKLDLNTPFNFVCTADIIGGNSGSPVINRNAEIVGLIFDGNIQSLVLDFAYTDKQARAVAVCSQAMIEALRKIYDAGCRWRMS